MNETNIYIQKSRNFAFQSRCFSMHKHKPLIKPMIVTATDSYIISISGPAFYAYDRNNDALNLRFMLKSDEENMLSWFE